MNRTSEEPTSLFVLKLLPATAQVLRRLKGDPERVKGLNYGAGEKRKSEDTFKYARAGSSGELGSGWEQGSSGEQSCWASIAVPNVLPSRGQGFTTGIWEGANIQPLGVARALVNCPFIRLPQTDRSPANMINPLHYPRAGTMPYTF